MSLIVECVKVTLKDDLNSWMVTMAMKTTGYICYSYGIQNFGASKTHLRVGLMWKINLNALVQL